MKLRHLIICLCLLIALISLAGCTSLPDNTQIETAIRMSLAEEAAPPVLEFDSMEVPLRSSKKANAVLWTADGEIQRNYSLEYDRKTRTFVVTDFTTGRMSADVTYHPIPNDIGIVLTELAPCFDFPLDFNQKYLLLYAGEGDGLSALRAEFERKKLSALTFEQLSSFEVCDLGGDALILLVPRYEGMSVWINELEHRSDLMITGAEVSRFENGLPVYIYCSYSDMLPEYEIHVSFDGTEEFFLTREALLTSIKETA